MGNEGDKAPGDLVKQIAPVFNRAVIFDTTCNSWHGLPIPLNALMSSFGKTLPSITLPNRQNVDVEAKRFSPTETVKTMIYWLV